MKWKLVPVEVTPEIREVIRNESCVYQSEDEFYHALLEAAPPAPSAPDGWRGLTDVEWMNIVNFDRAYSSYDKEGAVNEAVKRTEAKLKELNATQQPEPPADVAREVDPVAKVTGYYGGYLSISTIDGRVLPAGTALYLAPPAPSVPDGWRIVPYSPTVQMLERAAYAVNNRPQPSKYEPSATPAIILWTAMLNYAPEAVFINSCSKPPKLSDERIWEIYDDLMAEVAKGGSMFNFARAIEREILGGGHE